MVPDARVEDLDGLSAGCAEVIAPQPLMLPGELEEPLSEGRAVGALSEVWADQAPARKRA